MVTSQIKNNILLIDLVGKKNSLNIFELQGLNLLKSELDKDLDGVVINIDCDSLLNDLELLKYFKQLETSELKNIVQSFQELLTTLENLKFPVLTFVKNNISITALEFILISNHTVVTNQENISINLDCLKNGYFPFGGAVQRLTRLLGFDKATELFFNPSQVANELLRAIGIEFSQQYSVEEKLSLFTDLTKAWQKSKTTPIQSPKGYQFFAVQCAKLVENKLDTNKVYTNFLDCIYQGAQLPITKAISIDKDLFLNLF